MSIIVPQDVKDYSENPEVVARKDVQLEMDIRRATNKVLRMINRTEEDEIFEGEVPTDIKDATILYAEYFASIAALKKSSGIQSESFDDYSYTKADDAKVVEPAVRDLLSKWISSEIPEKSINQIVMRGTAF